MKGNKRTSSETWSTVAIGACLVVAAGLAIALWFQNRRPAAPVASESGSTAAVSAASANTNLAPLVVHQPLGAPTNTNLQPADVLPNDPVQLQNYGTELLNRGDLAGAVDLYSRALKLNPEDEEAHFNLGFAYSRLGNTNLAIKHYQDALTIFPDYPEAHNNLGNIYLGQRNYEKAMEHFTTSLTIQPENPSAMNNLGRCLAEQGKTKEAMKHFADAVRLNTNYVEAHYNLGAAYMTDGRYAEAITQFDEVLRLRPDFEPAIRALARARDRRQQSLGPVTSPPLK